MCPGPQSPWQIQSPALMPSGAQGPTYHTVGSPHHTQSAQGIDPEGVTLSSALELSENGSGVSCHAVP